MSKTGKIICLGKEFKSEEERRAWFRIELRAKLPELKKIEGFPIGEDEDIINLSDPPYYTACPNPWLNDFIAEWEKEKANITGRKNDFHVDEPYAIDVSEGKSHPIYNAHNYHTKVPHVAIIRYLLHYTQPGDIVFDGFAGTGMVGVAANLCTNPGNDYKNLLQHEWQKNFGVLPNWGQRKAICSDLSPVASLIAAGYNSSADPLMVNERLNNILKSTLKEIEWTLETKHTDGSKGTINNVVWSDVFKCPNCTSEIVYWDSAIDHENGAVKDAFNCPSCNIELTKRDLDKSWETLFDLELNETVTLTKSKPVIINYTCKGKRFNKTPDKFDFDLLERIKETPITNWFPRSLVPHGDKTVEAIRLGIKRINHLFSRRNLFILSKIHSKLENKIDLFAFTGMITRSTKQARFLVNYYFHGGGGWVGTNLSGTLYIPSLKIEVIPTFTFKNRIEALKALPLNFDSPISTQSASDLRNIPEDSVDYIFTDPPFGANIMYSELNLPHEEWIRVRTNNEKEAIENRSQHKTVLEYQNIMLTVFKEYYRILKPSKWITVEFSNTSAAVWNGLQTALQRAGFVIANVSGLDKKQGSFNAVTNPTSVKQDLVISCYKPSTEFENRFKMKQGEIVVWDFVSEHLHHLPSHVKVDNNTTAIVERSPKIIYDRLITFYLMRGLPVPIDAKEFQDGLKQRFVERDGMYFIAEQAAEYDEKKAKAPKFVQLSLIVTNESDAIEWLKDRLRKQAQKYQDIMPDFRIATQSLRKGDTLPELQDILNENFIQETDGRWRTPDPNEAKDREALRSKVLLKEFNGYVTAINQPRAKKLKEVRVEALRAGFKNCWEQKDFKTVVTLGEMIPQNILLEDDQLLMYYDIAKDRV
jgi:DNA modification methylase